MTKNGNGNLPAFPCSLILKHSAIISTTGTSNDTLNSLVIVAMSPDSGETAYPAPTTCATSWIVPPRKIPANLSSKPKTLTTMGYRIIASVLRAVTAITVKIVSLSLLVDFGKTADIAKAADCKAPLRLKDHLTQQDYPLSHLIHRYTLSHSCCLEATNKNPRK